MAAGWSQQLLGVAAVAGWLALLALAALQVRRRWHGQREWSRKLVHIGTGAVVPIAWATGIDRLIAIPAAALITLLAAMNHRFRLLPAIEDVGRASYGTIAYGASITLLLLQFWPQQPAAVAAGVLVMAVGDGLAGLLGPLVNSPCWLVWGQRKSVTGTGAMAAGSLAMLLLVRQLAIAAGLPHPELPALLAISATAVVLEQLAVGGLDNFTVPLAAGWLWQRLS
ncbi:MAG: dolichol kinase [Cyanobacteria bacterium]|nr:dolichol kinase [Cyanobacteriota bacterium]